MKLPKWLTTVTPFSKLCALFLFVTLPFFGFFAGIFYGQFLLLTESPPPLQKMSLQVQKEQSRQKKNTDFMYSLPFNQNIVLLDRMGSGEIKSTFWKKPIKII